MALARICEQSIEVLEQEFGAIYTASQFTRLKNHEVYAKLFRDAQWAEPFLRKTLAL